MREVLMIFYSKFCPICDEILQFKWKANEIELYCLEEQKDIFKQFDIKKVPFFILKKINGNYTEYEIIGSGMKSLFNEKVSRYLEQ